MPSSTPVSCNSKRDPRECYCVAGACASRIAPTRSNINVKVSDMDAAHGTRSKSNAGLRRTRDPTSLYVVFRVLANYLLADGDSILTNIRYCEGSCFILKKESIKAGCMQKSNSGTQANIQTTD